MLAGLSAALLILIGGFVLWFVVSDGRRRRRARRDRAMGRLALRVGRGAPVEWAWCLRCGQPLTSWYSRREGFGLQCAERLSRDERERLVAGARENLALERHTGHLRPWPFWQRLRFRVGLMRVH